MNQVIFWVFCATSWMGNVESSGKMEINSYGRFMITDPKFLVGEIEGQMENQKFDFDDSGKLVYGAFMSTVNGVSILGQHTTAYFFITNDAIIINRTIYDPLTIVLYRGSRRFSDQEIKNEVAKCMKYYISSN